MLLFKYHSENRKVKKQMKMRFSSLNQNTLLEEIVEPELYLPKKHDQLVLLMLNQFDNDTLLVTEEVIDTLRELGSDPYLIKLLQERE